MPEHNTLYHPTVAEGQESRRDLARVFGSGHSLQRPAVQFWAGAAVASEDGIWEGLLPGSHVIAGCQAEGCSLLWALSVPCHMAFSLE